MGRLILVLVLSLIIPALAIAGIFVDFRSDTPPEGADEAPEQKEQQQREFLPQEDGIRVPVPSASAVLPALPAPSPPSPPPPTELWERLIDTYYAEPARLPSSAYLASSSTPLFLQGWNAPEYFPVRNWEVAKTDPDAIAAVALEMPQEKILYQKNIEAIRPIASLTKLMTALVIAQEVPLREEVFITPNAIETPGEAGGLFVDEVLTVEQLLYALLLDSSNDAAIALEEAYHLRRTELNHTLTRAMNDWAEKLGLLHTTFTDPTGLLAGNRSTANDMALLLYHVYQNETLRKIMGTAAYDTVSVGGSLPHRFVNRNTLLGALPGVVGGKTGYTEEAGECMAIVTKIADERILITVVLGSGDRTAAQTGLIKWIQDAYVWE